MIAKMQYSHHHPCSATLASRLWSQTVQVSKHLRPSQVDALDKSLVSQQVALCSDWMNLLIRVCAAKKPEQTRLWSFRSIWPTDLKWASKLLSFLKEQGVSCEIPVISAGTYKIAYSDHDVFRAQGFKIQDIKATSKCNSFKVPPVPHVLDKASNGSCRADRSTVHSLLCTCCLRT